MAILWFILILGGIVLVHEFGHFIFSKLFGVYVYEFSIGMGPKIFHYKKKGGETEYCIRAIPIGGFVSLAGEDADDNAKIDKKRMLYSKPVWQRFIIMVAGATFNFVFAFVLLFISALIYGSISTKPIVANVNPLYPAYEAGIKEGDTILSVNGNKVSSWSEVQLYIGLAEGKDINFILKDKSGNKKEIIVKPNVVEDDEGNKSKRSSDPQPGEDLLNAKGLWRFQRHVGVSRRQKRTRRDRGAGHSARDQGGACSGYLCRQVPNNCRIPIPCIPPDHGLLSMFNCCRITYAD